MKCFYFALCFAQFRNRREALADGFSVHLPGQTEVWAMAGLVRLMATAVRLSAAALDGRNGAAAKITQPLDLGQNAGALLF